MYKKVFTLMRGTAHEAAEQFTDANALTILRQQIRDSTRSIQDCKGAVAAAMAQQQKETDQHDKITRKMVDLETRILAALENDENELAQQAADVLAGLEAERENSLNTQKMFQEQIDSQRILLREAQSILRELQRGERLATASQASQGLATRNAGTSDTALQAARETLQRLQDRQLLQQRTARAMEEISSNDQPETIAERLAKAGCGAPLQRSGDDVLARLKAKASQSSPAKKSA